MNQPSELALPATLPHAMAWFGTRHLSGTHAGPALDDLSLRLKDTAMAGTYASIAHAKQVHGVHVARVDAPGEVPDCDALWTTVPELFLAIKTADCVPLLGSFCARDGTPGVLAVHAGWRGAAAGIVAQTLSQIGDAMDVAPDQFWLCVGPCIGWENYEVGADVAAVADPRFLSRNPETPSWQLAMGGWVCAQAVDWGVPAAQVHQLASCTYAQPERFFSWRRHCHEGQTGLYTSNLSLVGVKRRVIQP